jgi:hypothetical protein
MVISMAKLNHWPLVLPDTTTAACCEGDEVTAQAADALSHLAEEMR